MPITEGNHWLILVTLFEKSVLQLFKQKSLGLLLSGHTFATLMGSLGFFQALKTFVGSCKPEKPLKNP
jgi:hypothetical protein